MARRALGRDADTSSQEAAGTAALRPGECAGTETGCRGECWRDEVSGAAGRAPTPAQPRDRGGGSKGIFPRASSRRPLRLVLPHFSVEGAAKQNRRSPDGASGERALSGFAVRGSGWGDPRRGRATVLSGSAPDRQQLKGKAQGRTAPSSPATRGEAAWRWRCRGSKPGPRAC